ncbi:hypothetical protein [Novosphingobium terrae]|uniref:hypothetical protein n=1 Tax=Novosphingobium terrae TaxID=2726189 RepID=UPI0019817A9F|nr:hypothetical protein [Novosphingobium terrae]
MLVKCSLPFLDWLSTLQSRTVKYNTIFVLNRLARIAGDDQEEVAQALSHARSVVGPSQRIELVTRDERTEVLVFTKLTRSRRHRLILAPRNNSFVDWDFENFVGSLDEVRNFIIFNLNHGDASTFRDSLKLMSSNQISETVSEYLDITHDEIIDAISCLNGENSQRFANLLKILNCKFNVKTDPAVEQARIDRMAAKRQRLRVLRGIAP